MKKKKPNYSIVETKIDQVVIKDEGPWAIFPTVTNGAEDVVEDLMMRGLLRNGVKLLYYDSDNRLGQLLHWHSKFIAYSTPKEEPLTKDPNK